ncbi:hypothetical protein [Kribbella shirazensis]|uniref:Uncharacterized protein n=1 Tax=Kribbella shirazensis TaxID=1105143 RepID=A0A7X5VI32_9ACTN|nr:hypothetical protein [Kribbella shirazensis]NIK60548.1 hypothetical protein [Kribbella shirazensis]
MRLPGARLSRLGLPTQRLSGACWSVSWLSEARLSESRLPATWLLRLPRLALCGLSCLALLARLRLPTAVLRTSRRSRMLRPRLLSV